jgi:hypothetical protein
MMQRTVRFSAIAAMTSLLSVAILMTAAHFDVAQAQKRRAADIACGKELQKHCTGIAIFATNALDCLKKDQDKLPKRCVAMANNIVRTCDRDSVQFCSGNVMGGGGILGCLTTARRAVSARCNAALDAAFVR